MADNDSAFPWFRWYNEASNDKKIDSICENLSVDYATVIGAWTLLLSAAACSPVRGSLYVTLQKRYSSAAVTKAMRCNDDIVQKLLQEFIDYEMIEADENGGYRIINFIKRQPPSDNSNPRVQKSRSKTKETVTKPLQDGYSNALDIDTDLDLNKDKENHVHPIQIMIEQITGKPCNGMKDLKAVDELEKAGVIKEDIQAGYYWYTVEKGNVFNYWSSIVKPSIIQMNKRIQEAHNGAPKKKTVIMYDADNNPVEREV